MLFLTLNIKKLLLYLITFLVSLLVIGIVVFVGNDSKLVSDIVPLDLMPKEGPTTKGGIADFISGEEVCADLNKATVSEYDVVLENKSSSYNLTFNKDKAIFLERLKIDDGASHAYEKYYDCINQKKDTYESNEYIINIVLYDSLDELKQDYPNYIVVRKYVANSESETESYTYKLSALYIVENKIDVLLYFDKDALNLVAQNEEYFKKMADFEISYLLFEEENKEFDNDLFWKYLESQDSYIVLGLTDETYSW